MTDNLKSLALRYRFEITKAICSGHTIEAIKLYREATGCDLASAYSAIESSAAQLRSGNPYVFDRQAGHRGIVWKRLVISGLAVLFAVIFAILPNFDPGRFRNDLHQMLREQPLFNFVMQNETPAMTSKPIVKEPAIMSMPVPESVSIADEKKTDNVYHPATPIVNVRDIGNLYRQKLANPDYRRWLDLPGLPKGYQNYPEEYAIKYARAQIAGGLIAPAGEKVEPLPLHSDLAIEINGVIDDSEWTNAKRFALSPATSRTVLYLQADAEWLYIACDVPAETTESGFDQLRFYFHIDIDPAIKNERIHLGPYGKRLGGIRQTTILRPTLQNGDERKTRVYPLSDWQIFRMATGATRLRQHRQYEAKLHLEESGLHHGVPFPVFVEVETDPLQENGKFKRRQYLGMLGSQQQPVWLMIM